VLELLADVDAELCGRVADNLGLLAPIGSPAADAGASPALSMAPPAPGPIRGRVVGILAADGVDAGGVATLRDGLVALGATVYVIAAKGGSLAARGRGKEGPAVDRTVATTRSVEYDALVVAGGNGSAATVANDPWAAVNLGEAFRHHKPIAAWGEGRQVLEAVGIAEDAPGVVTAENGNKTFVRALAEAMGWHRHWDR
jgi:catalase